DRAQHGLPRSGADEVDGRDAALPPATAAAHPLRRLGRGHRGFLSRSPHRRSYRAPRRSLGHAGGDRPYASPPRARPPVARPVRRLPPRQAARRLRAVDPAAASRHAARARASVARHHRAGGRRHRALHAARRPPRHPGRHPPESRPRSPQPARLALLAIHAELLARARAHLRLCRVPQGALARLRHGDVAAPDPARGHPRRRAALLDVLPQDSIRTARAKGLPDRLVIYRHAIWNTAIPFLTDTGLSIGFMLSGAIVIETVFSWPGLGRLIVQAIPGRDFPVI